MNRRFLFQDDKSSTVRRDERTLWKTIEYKRRLDDVERYGSQSMSYSALQEGIEEYRHAMFDGFVAYQRVWNTDYVLSNPITPRDNYAMATLAFAQAHKDVVFCQITRDYAQLLSRLGFYVNGLGVEHVIDFNDFEVSWRKRRGLKRWVSKLSKAGCEVIPAEKLSFLQHTEIEEINQQWLDVKNKGKELSYLARPFVRLNEPGVAAFALIEQGKVLGFSLFDPVYRNGGQNEIVSYVMQHIRVGKDAPQGAMDFLILKSLQILQAKGIRCASLGLSPLHRRDNEGFRGSLFMDMICDFMYKTKTLYHFRSLGEHKDRYQAKHVQTFVASLKPLTLRPLLGLMKVNHLI